jgi:hypothetical protein
MLLLPSGKLAAFCENLQAGLWFNSHKCPPGCLHLDTATSTNDKTRAAALLASVSVSVSYAPVFQTLETTSLLQC